MKRTETPKETQAQPPCMIAWHVTDKGEKHYWTRIGAVWEHADQEGYTLDLDLMPIKTGRIVLRAPRADDNVG